MALLKRICAHLSAAMKSNAQPKTGSGSYILSSTLPQEYRDASILKPSKTPSADDEATYTAFYTMVVSLIYLNANELSDQKLQRYLVRLNADQNVSSEKTELTLKRMERQGYLIKNVERPPVGQDGEHVVTWHVGPRAKEEIGKDGVIGMVQEVYGDWNPDLDRKLMASLDLKDRTGDGDDAAEEANGGESREQTAGDG